MDRARLDEIIALVNRVFHPVGYDCLEVEWVGSDKILRLYVDTLPGFVHVYPVEAAEEGSVEAAEPGLAETTPVSGITIEGCAQASRLLAENAELDAIFQGHYTLEVSSPGIERPLRRKQHFEEHLGDVVQIKLQSKVQERRNGRGKLLQVEPSPGDLADAMITIETEQGPWTFALTALQKASLVYDWGNG